MKIPPGTTSFSPPPASLHVGVFFGSAIRHTFRSQGTKDWLLIYTRAGSGLYRFTGGDFRSRPHDITLYHPGAFQDYQICPGSQKWDLFYAHFLPRPDWLAWLNWPEKSPGFMTLTLKEPALRRRVALRLRDMIRLSGGSLSRSPVFGQNVLEEILLWCDSINPRQASSQLDPRLGKAIDYLREHMVEPFSERLLAGAAGMSPSRLRHLFRAQTGNSPRRFLEEQRLRRARDLLSMSRQTIGEIAYELGFTNPFYFTLRFKKETGESPRAFRQRTIRK